MSADTPSLKDRLLQLIFRRYYRWRLQHFVAPRYLLLLEYWPKLESRYGEGRPPLAGLAPLFSAGDRRFEETLRSFAPFRNDLQRIAEAPPRSPTAPFWGNTWLTGLDAIALYGLLAVHRPTLYLEVGSGNSTKFARRAIHDRRLPTRIVSVDPEPRAEIDTLCNEVIRQRLEDVDLVLFDRLEAGDMLFIDNSHRVFQGGDVTVFFLEVLPRLKPGVLVHVHDIFLPFDYPLIWKERHYSEQYMLAAYLLGGSRRLELLLPVPYVEKHATLGPLIENTWNDEVFQRAFALNRKVAGYIGTSCWFRTT